MVDTFVVHKQPQSAAKGAFLLLHGMESHSGWFSPLFPLLTAAGYAAVSFDRPGWGRSQGERGRLDSYQEVLETVSRFASELRRQYESVHLVGMSWGGMAALYCALRRSWLFDSLTMIAPGIAARTDLSFTAKCRVAKGVLGKNPGAFVPTAFKPEHFVTNPDQQAFIANDPVRVHHVSSGFCIETLKMRRFIKQTAGKRRLPPATCLLAGNDKIIENDKVAAICRVAGVSVQTFPDCRHTLVFERPEAVAAAMVQQAKAAATPSIGNVWIAGAGAVGGTVASLLAFGGVRTSLLVKDKYLDSFQKNGLTLRAKQAERNSGGHISFASGPEGLSPDPDLLVIAVKSFDTDAALASFAGAIPERTIVASLQNGIGNEAKLAAAFPDNTIVAGSICASVEMPETGSVSWPDDRGGLGLALYQGSNDRARNICQNLFGRTGMECAWVDGDKAAERLKWSKLMLNIGFNALNSLTGMTSGAIMSDPIYGKLVTAALREGFACMDALHLQPVDLPGYPVSKLRLLVRTPDRLARWAMAWQAKRSTEAAFSMRQDVLKNRHHTEIAELNGVIVRIGKELGIQTPANAGLASMVEKR